MPEDTICKIKVVFQDPFHMKNLYKFIFFWLTDKGFLDGADGSSEETLERFYSEQVRSDVREYHIWWKTVKQPPNKYFKYKLDINFLGLGMKNTEVIKNDKKYKMQVGEITINLISSLVTEANDKNKSWENNFILKTFRPWFTERWYRTKIEQHEDELYEQTYELQRAIKDFLELKQYAPSEDIFFNKKGFE